MKILSATCVLTALLGTAICCLGATADTNQLEAIRRGISQAPNHPRLFWTKDQESDVKKKVRADPQMAAIWEAVRVTADHMLTEEPVKYRKDGRRLLGRSREALGRSMHLGFAYRMTGDPRYADRLLAEMRAMAAMPDWNPSHFLDTGEMTLAMAVGYDWMFDRLSADLRKEFRDAIQIKGLAPYLTAKRRHGWEQGGNNWNQVCHAGMVGGALALLEDDPQRAAEVVSRALAGLPAAMKVYNPDGTYPEGPGYWNYGTSFNVMLISMLESVFGSDFGLSAAPGFMQTGEFMLNIIGPTRRTYPFSDCGVGTGFSPAMMWFASRTSRPDLLWFEKELLEQELADIQKSRGGKAGDRYFPLVLLWGKAGMERKEPARLDWRGEGPNPLATFRSSWTDPNALFVAVKAGTPSASHAHLDIGSFILDALGERWSLDLGMQGYNELEQRGFDLWGNKQGAQRWSLFRYHNQGHSTLVVNGAEQVISSRAPISSFSDAPSDRHATIDLTTTYANELKSAVRKFSFSPEQVTIEDAMTVGAKDASIRWGMITPATVKTAGSGAAWLEQKGKRLRLEVASPAGVTIESWSAERPKGEFDDPNPGVTVVGFIVPAKAGANVKLQVILRPESK